MCHSFQRAAEPADEAATDQATLPPELARHIAQRVRDAVEVGDVTEVTAIAAGSPHTPGRHGPVRRRDAPAGQRV